MHRFTERKPEPKLRARAFSVLREYLSSEVLHKFPRNPKAQQTVPEATDATVEFFEHLCFLARPELGTSVTH